MNYYNWVIEELKSNQKLECIKINLYYEDGTHVSLRKTKEEAFTEVNENE